MANRYWVGGTGNSNDTAHWSTTSGGSGGASVPTATDAVFFDGNSGGGTASIVSDTYCLSLDFTGYTGTLASVGSIYVYGSVAYSATMSITWTGSLRFVHTGTATFNTAGKSIAHYIYIQGGGVLDLASDVVSSAGIQTAWGTINTNNYAITAYVIEANNNVNPGIWNLGSSTITLTGTTPVNFSSATYLTVNAGTSNIVCNNTSSITFTGANKTFYNVSFTGAVTSSVNTLINGNNTFNDLSITAPGVDNVIRGIRNGGTQTVNGTLSASGTTALRRIVFYAPTGTNFFTSQVAWNVAAVSSLTHTNWQNTVFAGAAAPWSAPLGVVDAGNNSGITFDATPLYWVGGAGSWNDATKWSTSSGGATANVMPGMQTPVYIDSASGTGSIAVSGTGFSVAYVGDINFTGYTGTFNISGGSVYVAGNTTLASGMTLTSTGTIYFCAIGASRTITSNGKSIPSATVIDGVGSTFTLQDAFSAQFFSVTNGTFTTNNFNVTLTGGFNSYGTSATTVNLGSSTVTISGGNINFRGCTINAGTSTLVVSGNALSVFSAASGTTLYNVTVTGISVIFSGGNLTVNNLTFNPATTTGYSYYISLASAKTLTVNGTLSITGPGTNKRVLVGVYNASTSATIYSGAATISAATVSLTNVDFYNVVATGAATWSGTSIGDAGSNTGITFATPKTVYWNLASGGNLISSIGWATSSGGTPAVANQPLPQDTAIIENTGLNSGATLTFNTGNAVLGGLTFSTRSNPVTFTWSATDAFLCGSIVLSSAVTMNGTSSTGFLDATLDSSGRTITQTLNINGVLTLASPLTVSASNLVVNRTLNLNSYNLTALGVRIGTANYYLAPSVYMGTGVITLSSSGLSQVVDANLTLTGSKTLNLTGSGGAAGTSMTTENNVFDVNCSGSSNISANIYARNLTFLAGYSGQFSSSICNIYGSLTLVSTMTTNNPQINYLGTGSNTITSAGKALGKATFNGIGGSWTLQDDAAFNSNPVQITNGTLNTNGYALTNTSTYNVTVEAGGTLTLGASAVTISGYLTLNTGATFNAGTSTVTCAAFLGPINGAYTAYDLILVSSSPQIRGLSSVRNLTFSAFSSSSISNVCSIFSSALTVTGTFTSNGSSTYRTLIYGYGYTFTPTVITAAAVSLSNTDFCFITGSGAASWSGTSLADAGGNSGITFDVTPRTLYWVGGTGTISDTNVTNWATSSGGAGGATRPLLCDTLVFDSNSGGGTITSSSRIGTLDTSAFTGTFSQIYAMGSATLGSAATFGAMVYYGIGKTLTTNGKTLTSLNIAGSLTLADNVSLSSAFGVLRGVLNTNNKSITAPYISCGGGFETVLNLGSSVITIGATGSTVSNFNVSGSGVTINAGTSEFVFLQTNQTLNATGVTFNKVTYGAVSSGGSMTFSGSNSTYGTLSSTVTGVHTIKFLGASTNTVNNWNISGTAGNLVTVTSTTTSQFTLVSGGGTQGADYLNLSYSIGSPSDKWYAGLNSVDGGNNTGWLFEEEPTVSGNGLFFGSNF